MRPPLYQPALTPRYGLVGEGSSAARGDDGVGTAEEAAAAGRDLQRRAARWLPALAGMAMARTTLAARVVPRDGLPALGWGCGEAAGTYVCAAHSGVTLARPCSARSRRLRSCTAARASSSTRRGGLIGLQRSRPEVSRYTRIGGAGQV